MRTFVDALIQRFVKIALTLGLEIRRAGMGGSQMYVDLRRRLIENSSGVLHIGAHIGQESETYSRSGKRVLWVEAIPEVHKELVTNLQHLHNQSAMNVLLGDVEKLVDFNVAENRGESSSVFEFSKTSRFGVRMSETLSLQMRRLDSILTPSEVRNFYSHWVIDVQGAELLVLKGSGSLLHECMSLDVEVSTYETYQGGAQLGEILKHLEEFGFIPVWKFAENSHGNLLFIRARSARID
jgi:FkbM family methyltransferase